MRAALVLGLCSVGCYYCPGHGVACADGASVVVEGPMADGDYHITASTDVGASGDCEVRLECARRAPPVLTCAASDPPLRMSMTCEYGIASITIGGPFATPLSAPRAGTMTVQIEQADGTMIVDHAVRLHPPGDAACGHDLCFPVVYVDL